MKYLFKAQMRLIYFAELAEVKYILTKYIFRQLYLLGEKRRISLFLFQHDSSFQSTIFSLNLYIQKQQSAANNNYYFRHYDL
jgi:hypothetical protein